MEDHFFSQNPEDESAVPKKRTVDGAFQAADDLIQELREAAGAEQTGGGTRQAAPPLSSGEAAGSRSAQESSGAPHQPPVDAPTADSVDVEMPTGPAPARGAELKGTYHPQPTPKRTSGVDLLMDVSLPVSIELGRTQLSISDILELGKGSIVELDKLAGEPVDILVNNITLAKGQVVVLDEHFGVRITSLVSHRDRPNESCG